MTEFVVHSRKGRTEDRMDSAVPTEKQARDLDYCTPRRVLDPVDIFFDGQIPLDPATNPANPTKAKAYFALKTDELILAAAWFKAHKSAGLKKYLEAPEGPFVIKGKKGKDGAPDEPDEHYTWRRFPVAYDGLRASWQDHTGVYVNPPYGGPLRAWLEKILFEASTDRKLPILALLPASRFEQGYFQDSIGACAMECMIRRRLSFTRPTTGEVAKGNPYSSILYGWNVDEDRFAMIFGSELGMCRSTKAYA